MTEDIQTPPAPSEITARVKRNARQVLLPAAVVLLAGWYLFHPISDPTTASEYAIAILAWSLRIGGIVLLGAAGICWTGALIGLVLDAVVSSCLAVVLTVSSLILLPAFRGGDWSGVIVGVIAAVYIRAAVGLWTDYGRLRAASVSAAPSVPANDDPASD